VFTKGDYDMTVVCHVERNDMAVYANPGYYFHYDSAKYQALIKTASTAKTPADQVAALKKAARLLANDSASDWLWLLPNLQVAKKGITGFPPNSVGDAYSVAGITKG